MSSHDIRIKTNFDMKFSFMASENGVLFLEKKEILYRKLVF